MSADYHFSITQNKHNQVAGQTGKTSQLLNCSTPFYSLWVFVNDKRIFVAAWNDILINMTSPAVTTQH